ncbi:hypothetical protein MSAN_01349000 [Mycena sanguinolenta]|uniref:Uncharacterized protein n=1 Tax=Mycena sanguinolenta TaxID=230812 RepID=A0A8H6YE78_9AGAR|nr:hypothetical protein MSAN_01349000 [Mycena sanguinolenta]
MAMNGGSVRASLAEQTDRTRRNSKTDITQFIEESELKITSLESQLSTLRDRERSCVDAPQDIFSQIDTLVGLRDRESACVDSLRYIISPIRTLPIELLVEIFEFAIGGWTIIEHVFKNASRLRYLDFESCPFWLFSRLVECRLDSLEELQLGWAGSNDKTATSPELTMAPYLRKLSLILDMFSFPGHKSPTSGLNPTLSILPSISLPNAQHSPLQRYAFPDGVHLDTLSLNVECLEYLTRFLGAVSAPALEALYLDFLRMQDTQMQSAAPLISFLIHSPNITQLKIQAGLCAPPAHELIDTLRHTPGLTHLELSLLSNISLDDTLLEALFCKDGIAPLVPHLHSFGLFWPIKKDQFTLEALERMLVSRWQANDQITSGSPAVASWRYVGLDKNSPGAFLDSLRHKGLPVEATGYLPWPEYI